MGGKRMREKCGMRAVVFAVVFAVVLPFTGVYAQNGEEDVFDVEEVIFTGTRVEENEGIPVEKLPASVISINADELKKTQDDSLPETLSRFPGFHYMDTVGLGGDAKLHLRGFGEFPGNIVLLDGVRINEGAFHEVVWKSIPLDAIEKIEVIKGGISSSYGEGALTGVVNIITKKKLQKTTLNTLWGGLGKQQYSVLSGVSAGRLNILANAFYDRNKGFRSGSNFEGSGAFIKLSNAAITTRYTLSVNVHKNKTDIPDSLTAAQLSADPNQPGDCFSNYDNSNSTASFTEIFNFKGFSTTTNVYYRKRDSYGKFTCPAFAFTGENETNGKAYGGVLQLNKSTSRHHFTAGIEYGKEFFDNTPKGDPRDIVNRKSFAYFLQDIYDVAPKLSLSAGVRRDDVTFDMEIYQFSFITFAKALAFKGERKATATSPKFGITYKANEKTSMYVSAAKSFLAPTGFQFTGFQNPFLSNPTLEPTESKEISLGFRHKTRATKTEVTFFQLKTSNEIIFNNETFANENVDVKRTGAELSVEHQFAATLSGRMGYSLLASEFESDKTYFGKNISGKSMPFAPESTLSAGLFYSPSPKWEWNVSTLFVNNFYPLNDLNNESRAKDYNVTNVKVKYNTGWGNISGHVNNIFNVKYSSFPTSNGQSGAARTEKFNPQNDGSFGISAEYAF